jgi:hypothetical protein
LGEGRRRFATEITEKIKNEFLKEGKKVESGRS